MSAKKSWALIVYISVIQIYFCYCSMEKIIPHKGTLNNESYFAIDASSPHAHSFILNATQTQSVSSNREPNLEPQCLINNYCFELSNPNLIICFQHTNVRIEVSVQNNSWDHETYCPIIFSLRHHQSSKSWALPEQVLTGTDHHTLRKGGFTVCLSDIETDQNLNQTEFLIVVSTCSKESVSYTLLFNVSQTGFMLQWVFK